MKSFKTYVTEVSAQKASKDFEDYIWQLAVLSGGKETNTKKLSKILDKNKTKFPKISAKHKKQTLAAVSHLNKFFKKKWTKGYNANFAKIPSPAYGSKSAKADIVLESGSKKYGLSVKMEGSYVVVSAQNKDEFEGIFYSALDYFERKESVKWDLSEYKKGIEDIKKEVKSIKTNIIGETLTRHLDSDHFDSLKKKKEFADHKRFLKNLKDNITKQNKKINNDYDDLMKNVVKVSQKKIRDLITENKELSYYIVWEALTATLKYDGQLPAAQYVISPKGCYDIKTPDSSFVKSVASASTIGIRGMVHGTMRSGRGKAIKKYLDKSKVNWKEVYDDVNKMDMSLKWDMPETALKSLDVNEGFVQRVADFYNKIKNVWNKIKANISSAITSATDVANKILDKLTELKNVSFVDLIKGTNIELTGNITIK
tara:strand:- start:72 stop:1352 length:1281 start_codon:yes stop_codon:yes gene_type:complete